MGFLSRLLDPGKKTRNAAIAASQQANLRGFTATGPGGSGSYDPSTGAVNVQLDPTLQGLQAGLFGQAGQQAGMGQGYMDLVNQLGMGAIGGMGGVSGGGGFGYGLTPNAPGFANLPQFQQQGGPMAGLFGMGPGVQAQPTNFSFGTGQQLQANLPQFQPQYLSSVGGPFDPNRRFSRQLSTAAAGLIPGASQDIAGAEQDALARLRAQAAPQERQAMSDLNERLYGTGQGAVTGNANVELGGGRLAQAFGRGLGQADLDRQVQAQSMALQRREGDLSALQGLFGQSGQFQGLSEQLRQGQFGRDLSTGQFNLGQQAQAFGQAMQGTQLSEQLQQGQFGRNLAGAQFGLGQAGQNFQQQLAAGQFGQTQLQNLFGRQLAAAQFGAGENQRGFDQAVTGAGLQNQLAQSLFGQQLQAGQFQQGINQQNFQQQLAQQGFNNQMLQQAFGIGTNMQQAQQGMNQQNIANQLGLIGAGMGMYALPQQLFALGMNAENNRSAAALGQAGQLSNIAQSTPNPFLDLAVGAMGMAGKFGGASDRRLKDNLRHILDEPATGLPIYAWDWNDAARKIGVDKQPPIGLIAQEVQEKYPDFVYERKGYLHIDYRGLIEELGV